jgi:glycosyltransferase involved in cell wall biosynthesis
MQPKVSMMMPCYNKAAYIGHMFDSIIAQRWDNIELILVNDGSTDGTRKIIAAYEPRFRARGFETVIVDQENRGLPGAVHTGLTSFTGEFVCQVDADDELDPEYVSTMAGFLEQNPEYDWVACDMKLVGKDEEIYQGFRYLTTPEEAVMANLAECFLIGRIRDTVPNYMVRASYLMQSGMVESYVHWRRRTQEPQFALPLAVAGGKLMHIARPLYRYHNNSIMMSLKRTYMEKALYYKQYDEIVSETLERMAIAPEKKKRLSAIADYCACKKQLYAFEAHCSETGNSGVELCAKLCETVNSMFSPSSQIGHIALVEAPFLMQAVEDNILGIPRGELTPKPAGRIVAWGALGTRGRRFLPHLAGTPLEPDELWDAAGDGAEIKKPDTSGLGAGDLVLVLPTGEISDSILRELENTECDAMLSDEISRYISSHKFPQFYD